MKEYKRLKDPIYGYIHVPVKYMNQIVDTSPFQRLRRISQTSYSPLYASAEHNRFVHSIGVFYLGKLAAKQLKKEIIEKHISFQIELYGELFQLACLLHDIGHAPFSHTGENLYLIENHDCTQLHNKLIKVIGNPMFQKDIPKGKTNPAVPVPDVKSNAAAAHEIMSAIIGISEYGSFFDNMEQKEFFARCITGYQYSDHTIESSIKNCFIALLNSEVIDVDKLDYLIRDAYITGFDTINIDFERLLSSLTISIQENQYQIAYNKNAISVIENVVYAHDAEKKWIQNHPIVLYEAYILRHIMANLAEKIDTPEKKLFSMESLSKEGQQFTNNLRISLLCDDDIIYLMKNVFPNDLSREYFERKLRRHPVWKSEAEYKAFILNLANGGTLLQTFETAMGATAKYLEKNTDSWVIDDDLIHKLEKDNETLESLNMDIDTKKVQEENKSLILKVMHSLQSYAAEKKMDCNFVILMEHQFDSGFGKSDFSSINIAFHTKEGGKISKVGDIVSSLKAKEKDRENFFYLFYQRKEGMPDDIIDNQEICKRLFFDVAFSS